MSMGLRPAAFMVSPDSASRRFSGRLRSGHSMSQWPRFEGRVEGIPLTNKIDDAICDTQGACCLHAAAQLDDLGPQLAVRGPPFQVAALLCRLQPRKVLLRKVHEASANVLADQILARGVAALDGDLHLELARAEAEVHDRLAPAGPAVLRGPPGGDPVFARQAPGLGRVAHARFVLLDLVKARDAQVDLALADKGWDVRGGEEDESDGQVLDEGNVQTVLPAELDICALQ